jgi:putative pyruvate formate lyase activating enzyme
MISGYLQLSKREFKKRIEALFKILENCHICPRNCAVNRKQREKGFCQLGYLPVVSSFHPHCGEERVLVGKMGSGTIFFTSCNLACVYCQNYEISQLRQGKEFSFEQLAQAMLELQNLGCHNLNLVTPSPQVPQIVKALFIAREQGLKIPVVYNTNAYDSLETLKLLEGLVDIYMPDLKYGDNETAERYSGIRNYVEVMKQAVKEMHRQVGDLILDKNGIAVRGLLVRHLILPNNLANSEEIFKFLAEEVSLNTFINIMDQYYPCYRAYEFPEINRGITNKEFQKVLKLVKDFGFRRIYF